MDAGPPPSVDPRSPQVHPRPLGLQRRSMESVLPQALGWTVGNSGHVGLQHLDKGQASLAPHSSLDLSTGVLSLCGMPQRAPLPHLCWVFPSRWDRDGDLRLQQSRAVPGCGTVGQIPQAQGLADVWGHLHTGWVSQGPTAGLSLQRGHWGLCLLPPGCLVKPSARNSFLFSLRAKGPMSRT